MSCINPNLIRATLLPSGEVRYMFSGAGLYRTDEISSPADLATNGSYSFLAPCGKCPGCRLDRAKEWSDRLCLEYYDNDCKAVFLTLTYNNDNLPIYNTPDGYCNTLDKRDWQDFMKRLRNRFSARLRFFACGEYGPSTHRPHYHAIIFGITLSDLGSLDQVGSNEFGQAYYSSSVIGNCWSSGFHTVSDVDYLCIRYVARYNLKKFASTLDNDIDFTWSDPEFTLMSRRPGIGYLKLSDYLEQGVTSISVPFASGPQIIAIPTKAIRRFLPNFSEDFLDGLLYNRSLSCYNHLRSELASTGLSGDAYFRRLSDRYSKSIEIHRRSI